MCMCIRNLVRKRDNVFAEYELGSFFKFKNTDYSLSNLHESHSVSSECIGAALLLENIIYRNAPVKVSRVGNFEIHKFPSGERLFSIDLNTYYLREISLQSG